MVQIDTDKKRTTGFEIEQIKNECKFHTQTIEGKDATI